MQTGGGLDGHKLPPGGDFAWWQEGGVTGAPCRKMDSKRVTAPKIPFVESATPKYREESDQ